MSDAEDEPTPAKRVKLVDSESDSESEEDLEKLERMAMAHK